MCGDQIKAVEQKGVAQNTVALMRWFGKELRGEQNVQTATILFSSFFPLIFGIFLFSSFTQ